MRLNAATPRFRRIFAGGIAARTNTYHGSDDDHSSYHWHKFKLPLWCHTLEQIINVT